LFEHRKKIDWPQNIQENIRPTALSIPSICVGTRELSLWLHHRRSYHEETLVPSLITHQILTINEMEIILRYWSTKSLRQCVDITEGKSF